MLFFNLGPAGAAVVAAMALASNVETTATAAARGCAETLAGEPQRLRIRVIPDGMNPRVLELARQEVDEIWRQYHVEITWLPELLGDVPKSAYPDLWVQFVDGIEPYTAPRGTPAIAWIVFANGVPQQHVRVSRPRAERMLQERSWLDGRKLTAAPPEVQLTALARVIGRALAHEIGHFLLATRGHAKEGLMRAALPPDRLVRPGRGYFVLEPADVRALRTARIESCETAQKQGRRPRPAG